MSDPTAPFDFEKGEILLINKPKTWTSFDVVKKIRYATKQKKVGHAGTLDPLAEGLLIIAVGKTTKQLNDIQGMKKEYDGIIEIGKTTPSYDLETDFDSELPFDTISSNDIDRAAESLTGWIDQVPPIFSAIKKDGERAYKKARKGQEIELKSRKVNIESFKIDEINLPEIKFTVTCSKGTYIRSLAHDLGQILGTGAYLKHLRRIAIGEYRIEDALSIEEFIDKLKAQ